MKRLRVSPSSQWRVVSEEQEMDTAMDLNRAGAVQ
jgi:hypothetical protein